VELKEELQAARDRMQDKIHQLQQLDDQKQELLQEILRLDGEIRVLSRLNDEEEKDEKS